MTILLIIIGALLHYFATPILCLALICFFFVARRLYREKKSLDALQGHEAAKALAKERFTADMVKILGRFLFPVVFVGVMYLIVGAAGLSAIVAAFFAALTAAFALSGFCRLQSAAIKQRFRGSYKETIVRPELAKVFQNLRYTPDQAFPLESISQLDVLADFDGYSGDDLLVAEYRGLHFSQFDMKVMERHTVSEAVRGVFNGRVMRFDFSDPFMGKVQVRSKDFAGAANPASQGAWQEVETGPAEFSAAFDVYASSPQDAAATLAPQILESISSVKTALNVPAAFSFSDRTMTVFLALTRDAFDASGTKTLLEECTLLTRDIALMTGFMDIFFANRLAEHEAAPPPLDGDRSAIAATVAAAARQSWLDQTVFGVWRALVAIRHNWPLLVIAVYAVSAVYGLVCLPSDIGAGITWGEDGWTTTEDAMQVPALGFLIVSGVFIVISARARAVPVTVVSLALYLLFLTTNL